MADTLSDLLSQCRTGVDAGYAEKYLHDIPEAPVVDRVAYLVDRCRGKRVLSLGASGPLESALRAVDAKHYAVGLEAEIKVNLDLCPGELYRFGRSLDVVDIVVAGEILEHLSNPGNLLDAVRLLHLPMIVTAPNAFAALHIPWLRQGKENVNDDHVAFYSWKTLTNLLTRHGFKARLVGWYGGKQPIFAEGLIVEAE